MVYAPMRTAAMVVLNSGREVVAANNVTPMKLLPSPVCMASVSATWVSNVPLTKMSKAAMAVDRVAQLEDLRQLGAGGQLDLDGSVARRFYAGQLSGQMLQIDHDRETLGQQLARCREELGQRSQAAAAYEALGSQEGFRRRSGALPQARGKAAPRPARRGDQAVWQPTSA